MKFCSECSLCKVTSWIVVGIMLALAGSGLIGFAWGEIIQNGYNVELSDGTVLEADLDLDMNVKSLSETEPVGIQWKAGFEVDGDEVTATELAEYQKQTDVALKETLQGLENNESISKAQNLMNIPLYVLGGCAGLVLLIGAIIAACAASGCNCNGCNSWTAAAATSRDEDDGFQHTIYALSAADNVTDGTSNNAPPTYDSVMDASGRTAYTVDRRRLEEFHTQYYTGATRSLPLYQAIPILVVVPLMSTYLAHRCLHGYRPHHARKPVTRRSSRRPSDVLLGFTAP